MVFHIPLPQWVVEHYIRRWYFMSPSLSELLSITYPDGTSHPPPSVSCWALHTQMVLHIPFPQWVDKHYIPRWYFMSPSLSELLSVTYPDGTSHPPPSVRCWALHTQMVLDNPCLSEMLSVTYPDGTWHSPPSVSCSVLHTQMVLHIPLPQWDVECYIPRWYFMSPSFSELLSITYQHGTSHPPPSVSCWALHTQMVLHVSLPQWVVEHYILRWYFRSPSLSELISITYPDGTSRPPPSVRCWVLHTKMVLHIPFPQWVDKHYIPRWYFMSPSLSQLLSVTSPDGTSHPPPSVRCWALHTQMVLDTPSLSEMLSVTYQDGTWHSPPSVSCSVLHTQMVFHIPLPQWDVECYIPRWYFMFPSFSELLSITYQHGTSHPPLSVSW